MSLKSLVAENKSEIWGHCLATSAAVISRLSMLLITLMNTQFLSPREFGLFAILSLIANMIVAFVSCGGDMWLNRFCRARHVQFEKVPIVSRFYLQISVMLAAFIVFCALACAIFGKHIFVGQELAVAFCLLWAATSGLIETVLAILRTTNEIHRFFVIRDLFMPITLMFAIFILKINNAFEFFLIAFILWLCTLFFLLNHIFSRSALYMPRSHWTWKLLKKELIGYTANLVINNFTSRLANCFDILLLTRILPIDVVGRYRLLAQFSNAFIVVQHFVFLTLPWHLRQSKTIALAIDPKKTIRSRQHLLLISAIPVLILFIIIAKPIMSWLGEDYRTMAMVLSLLLLIRFSALMWGPQHETLISNNKVFEDTKANLLAILSGVIIFYMHFNHIGAIKSAIIAITIGSLMGQMKRFYAIREKLPTQHKQKLPWVPIVINTVALCYVYSIT